MAGATGIDRGPACRGTGLGWTSPDREIRSLSQKCERVDLNLGGSLILGFIIRSTYFGLILRLDLDILWHVPVVVAKSNNTVASCVSPRRYACLERENIDFVLE